MEQIDKKQNQKKSEFITDETYEENLFNACLCYYFEQHGSYPSTSNFVLLVKTPPDETVIREWNDNTEKPTREQIKKYTVAECADAWAYFMKCSGNKYNPNSILFDIIVLGTQLTLSYTYTQTHVFLQIPSFLSRSDPNTQIFIDENSLPILARPRRNIEQQITIINKGKQQLGIIEIKTNGSMIISAGLNDDVFSGVCGFNAIQLTYSG